MRQAGTQLPAKTEKERTMEEATILIADDESEILDILETLLKGEGYAVVRAGNGREAVELASDGIDMYILDVGMPEMSGFAAAMQIRKKYMAPMMFLTAYSGEADRELGFNAGADDYLVKPFSNTELLLRVKSLLRRSRHYSAALNTSNMSKTSEQSEYPESPGVSESPEMSESPETPAGSGSRGAGGGEGIAYKDIFLDVSGQVVRRGDEVIRLTYTEFRILELFLRHPGKIFSMENIYGSVWEDDVVGDETIMVHIKNLRKKLGDSSREPKYIRTAWGKGYYVD